MHGYAPAAGLNREDWSDDYLWLEDWLLSKQFREQTREQLMKLFDDGGSSIAMTTVELSSRLSIDTAMLEPLLQELKQEEKLHMKRDAWMQGGGASEE